MKGKIVRKIVFIALICILGAFALFGCEKKPTRLTSDKINGLNQIKEQGLIRAEWLSEYDAKRPTVVLFPGEADENAVFSPNLPISVYTHYVTYLNEDTNENTIGLKANGLKAVNGEYVLTDYWTITAGYNVLILHYERFFAESTENVLAKIYTAYKSRYVAEGKTVDVDFGYSFAEVMTCFLYEELKGKNVSGEELRFIGNGAGANLAYATAYLLYKDYEKGVSDDVLPLRVTACDPFISGTDLRFACDFLEDDGTSGSVSMMAKSAAYLAEKNVATEWIESEEINGDNKTYAYSENVRRGQEYETIKKNVASLTLTESYSAKDPFTDYKKYKRVAFDWYFYSIVGSDDSKEHENESQKFPVGYPTSYNEFKQSTLYDSNWSYDASRWDARRPILNNRRLTNDYSAIAAEYYGFNFAVGAWTPTLYIFGLRGVAFVQKEGRSDAYQVDGHGNEIFLYEDYVLQSFSSENYQYADLNASTILVNRCYFDENEDGVINDGHNGKEVQFDVTIAKNTGETLFEKTRIKTDADGYYFIVLHDKTSEGERLSFVVTGNKIDVYGYAAEDASEDGVIIVESTLVVPRGYEARLDPASGMKYNTISMNQAENGKISVSIKKYVVHSVLTRNTLIRRESNE